MISNFLYVCIELLHTIVFEIIYSCRADFVANFTFVIHHFDFNYTLFVSFHLLNLKDLKIFLPSAHTPILPLTQLTSFSLLASAMILLLQLWRIHPIHKAQTSISILSPELLPSALLAVQISCHVTQNSVCTTQVRSEFSLIWHHVNLAHTFSSFCLFLTDVFHENYPCMFAEF